MKLEQVGSLTQHNHHRLSLGATALITVAALATSLYLRFERYPFSLFTREVAMTLSLLLITRALTYRWYELFHTRWRYTSPPEAIAISKAHLISSLPLMLPFPFGVLPILPHSVVLGECLLSILFVFGSRLSIRALSEHLFFSTSPQQAARREVLVIGAGVSGHLFVRTILTQTRLNFVPI
jgi:FlaA1/EpsC-like NDP-sugar epimerase